MSEHFVYLISAENYHKIGVSKNIDLRIANIQTSCPLKVDLVHKWAFGNASVARKVESDLHSLLEAKRVRGEWFELDQSDVSELLKMEFGDLPNDAVESNLWNPPELPKLSISNAGIVIKGVISGSPYSVGDVADGLGITRQTLSKQFKLVTNPKLILNVLEFLGYETIAVFETRKKN